MYNIHTAKDYEKLSGTQVDGFCLFTNQKRTAEVAAHRTRKERNNIFFLAELGFSLFFNP